MHRKIPYFLQTEEAAPASSLSVFGGLRQITAQHICAPCFTRSVCLFSLSRGPRMPKMPTEILIISLLVYRQFECGSDTAHTDVKRWFVGGRQRKVLRSIGKKGEKCKPQARDNKEITTLPSAARVPGVPEWCACVFAFFFWFEHVNTT